MVVDLGLAQATLRLVVPDLDLDLGSEQLKLRTLAAGAGVAVAKLGS